MSRPAVPIACTLDVGAYRDRLAWLAALNRDALVASARTGARLESTYRREALDRVRVLVAQETSCCAFLQFDLQVDDTGPVRLAITAPDDAGDLDELFSVFRWRG